MSNIFIFTLTWNAEEKLINLYNSIKPILNQDNVKWFIKDNDSKDNTAAIASTWENTNLIKYPNNLQNFAQGMNYLFNIASPKDSDYIVLLNNDVVCQEISSIKNMISMMDKDSNVGVVGARLMYPNSDVVQHAGVGFLKVNKMPWHIWRGEKLNPHMLKNKEFQTVTGAVLLTKAGLYKNVCTTNQSKINGMDERYNWSFEDTDLCFAIKFNMNKKIVYCGDTNFSHEESASLKKNPQDKLFVSNNVRLFTQKWHTKYIADYDFYKNNINYNLYK